MTVKPTNFYFYALVDVPGVVAANNFLSIFNPVGSGKALVFFSFAASSYSITTSQTPNSMQVHRTTAASGGTLVAETNINRFDPVNAPASVAQIRTGNPTTTDVGHPLIGIPPIISTGTGAVSGSTAPPAGAGFIVYPGAGITTHTAAGNTNQLWNIQYIWAEI